MELVAEKAPVFEGPPVGGDPDEIQESKGSPTEETTTRLQQPPWDWEQIISLDGSG